MAKLATARSVDLEPIDRLEEKIKLLVGMVTDLRADQARAADENASLTQEIAGLRARLADSESVSAEISALRDERDIIRTRVGDMLEQLEHLSL
jgi:regulator of replication initiation timing